MKKRKVLRKRKPRVRRERDPIPWKYCILTLICGLLFVSGFFLAATNHFSSMAYGMKNSKLRRQIEGIKSRNRRLLLSREISLSPSGIKEAGRKIGLSDMTVTNIEIAAKTKPIPSTSIGKNAKKAEVPTNISIQSAIRNNSLVSKIDKKNASKKHINEPRGHRKGSKKESDKIEDDLIALEQRISMNSRKR